MEPAPPHAPAYAREGRLARWWGTGVLLGLGVALFLTAQDIVTCHLPGTACEHGSAHLRAWQVYFWVQLASKLPISYRYTPRGVTAAADLLGFGVGMVSVTLFGLGVAVDLLAARMLAVGVGTWFVFYVVVLVRWRDPGESIARRALTAAFGTYANAPMLMAALALG